MYHGQLESGEFKMLRCTDKFSPFLSRIFKVMIQIASAVESHHQKENNRPRFSSYVVVEETNRYINVSFRARCTIHARSTRGAIFEIIILNLGRQRKALQPSVSQEIRPWQKLNIIWFNVKHRLTPMPAFTSRANHLFSTHNIFISATCQDRSWGYSTAVIQNSIRTSSSPPHIHPRPLPAFRKAQIRLGQRLVSKVNMSARTSVANLPR